MGSFIKQRMFCPVLIPISKHNILGSSGIITATWFSMCDLEGFQRASVKCRAAQWCMPRVPPSTHTPPSDSPKPDYTAFPGFLNGILIKLLKKKKGKPTTPPCTPPHKPGFTFLFNSAFLLRHTKGFSIRLPSGSSVIISIWDVQEKKHGDWDIMLCWNRSF